MKSYNPKNWYWMVGGDTAQVFSSASGSYVDVADSTYTQWVDDGGTLSRIASEAELLEVFATQAPGVVMQSVAGLIAYAATARYAKEVGGITVAGLPVATDDRSKQMIMGARIAASADSTFTTPWVGSNGSVVTLNASQIIALSNAVLAHVQECFLAFASVASEITAGTVTTTAEIDAAFAS